MEEDMILDNIFLEILGKEIKENTLPTQQCTTPFEPGKVGQKNR